MAKKKAMKKLKAATKNSRLRRRGPLMFSTTAAPKFLGVI